jgi:hypothetical protein
MILIQMDISDGRKLRKCSLIPISLGSSEKMQPLTEREPKGIKTLAWK